MPTADGNEVIGGATPISGSGGTMRKSNFLEKHTRQWGVRVLSAMKIPSSINLAMEVAVAGVPQFHRRHNVFSPPDHKWVFPVLRWETCLPKESTEISLAPTRAGTT